jgi:hypothetical protein
LLAKPGGIGVDGLAEDEFITDGENNGVHFGLWIFGFKVGNATGEATKRQSGEGDQCTPHRQGWVGWGREVDRSKDSARR